MTTSPCCPIHRDALRPDGPGALVGVACGERYPIIDGVPVLLADPRERRTVAESAWEKGASGGGPLAFYNRPDDHDGYCREALDEVRADLERRIGEARCDGPVLEIGSGKGALQGFGGDYVAVDYSLTALRSYLRPEHQRVCASATHLPFPDGTFRFIFSIAAIEHVPEADLAFAEIARVLRPGGVAYLAPAWHCVQYNCEGIPVRPYRDLDLRQKFVKLTLPLRQTLIAKALGQMPSRLVRRARWALDPRPIDLQFERLRPDYEHFWLSDSDAAARLDSHEGCLFFHSRGYDVLQPGPGAARQLLFRHGPLLVRKPAPARSPFA